ncbi:MAG TPA: siderophore-interacting protein [Trueperaceae bacterium]|nr:siderophore-interacting protein [Trueperaceae bacterium]
MAQATPRTWSGPNRTGRTQVNMIETVGRRTLTVSRVEALSPRYRRVYLTGSDLDSGFPYVRFAPTDHVKVVFPQPDTGELVLPVPGARGLQAPEGAPRPAIRDYTVRAWLPETQELVIEIVVHGHGVASTWAAAAQPGDRVGVMGPRGNIVFPENYAWYLLAGDSSALPSMSRIIEELPDGAGAHAVIVVEDEAEVLHLDGRPGIEVTWVLRDRAGVDGLLNGVRAVTTPDHDDWFAFVAGEVGLVRTVRDYLRAEKQLPRERLVVDGYWLQGTTNLDHHAIDLDTE